MSAQSLLAEKDLAPALLALRALRASLGMDVPADLIVMGAEGQVLEDRHAAQLLMTLGPCRCSAMYQASVVAIDCRVLGPQEQEKELKYFQLTNGWVGDVGREALAQSGGHLTMVMGGGAPLLVDIEDLDSAARMFDIDMDGFTTGGRYPTDAERAQGVGWVLQFSGRSPTPTPR